MSKVPYGKTLPKWNPETPSVTGWEATPFATGEPQRAEDIKIRGKGYPETKKVPSLAALYEPIGVDLFYRTTKLHHITRRIDLGLDPDAKEELPLPEIIVLNALVPDYRSVWASDGTGASFVVYYRMSEALRKRLQDCDGDMSSLPEGDRLLERFVNSNPNSGDIRNRFKCISRISNLPDVQLGYASRTLVAKGNGTPFIVAKTASFYRGTNYFEFVIDAHMFSMTARTALLSLRQSFTELKFVYACTIQGNTDEERPEVILGCVKIHHMDPTKADKGLDN